MALLFGRNAHAENVLIDGSPQDVWFQFETGQVFTVRTFAVGVFSDPMLWLYDPNGVLVAANDDWFGLQSNIEVTVGVGVYRLRAGFCCGDPNALRPGQRYEVGSSVSPVPTTVETSTSLQTTLPETSTTTSTTTTTSVPQSTTTQETTTTTQSVAPSTTDPVPSSTDLLATSLPPTTLQESTTTSDAPETTLPETTVSETIHTTVVSTSIPDVTTTLTTLPPKPQATTPPQTSTTTPTLPPVTSTSPTPLTTAPPETLETTTTTEAPGEILPNILTNPEQINDAIAQADTPAERAALTATLNKSSDKVKQAFEQKVNVYSGNWDTYVPAGSRIPVGERRTLIAVMGGLVSLASTAPRRKN